MSNPPALFDNKTLTQRRHRANPDGLFLQEMARDEILEKLAEVNRSFTKPLIVTPFRAVWEDILPNARIISPADNLGLAKDGFDLVIHSLALHSANDPVGQLIQARLALQPDGLFIAATFGGETLAELRTAMTQAEAEATGGVSPRIAPMADIRDYGGLLQRAGFALPVCDGFSQAVQYRDIWRLMRDLRDMGEANALADRLKRFTRRAVFERLPELYPKAQGGVEARFELVFLSGWAPHENQQKPLRPGSGKMPFAQALNALKID